MNHASIGKISDDLKSQIVVEELNKFKSLIKGHEKILQAIGNL